MQADSGYSIEEGTLESISDDTAARYADTGSRFRFPPDAARENRGPYRAEGEKSQGGHVSHLRCPRSAREGGTGRRDEVKKKRSREEGVPSGAHRISGELGKRKGESGYLRGGTRKPEPRNKKGSYRKSCVSSKLGAARGKNQRFESNEQHGRD